MRRLNWSCFILFLFRALATLFNTLPGAEYAYFPQFTGRNGGNGMKHSFHCCQWKWLPAELTDIAWGSRRLLPVLECVSLVNYSKWWRELWQPAVWNLGHSSKLDVQHVCPRLKQASRPLHTSSRCHTFWVKMQMLGAAERRLAHG